MKYIKFFLIILTLLFIQSANLYAEKIVYINIEKIMKESKAGKAIIKKIEKTKK